MSLVVQLYYGPWLSLVEFYLHKQMKIRMTNDLLDSRPPLFHMFNILDRPTDEMERQMIRRPPQ